MGEGEYTLEEISYSRKEDCRIMEAVLKNWFQSPKALNFVSPSLTFPFKFKKWVSVFYADMVDKTMTIVLKKDNWIIGHISMKIVENNAHLFHLFIAPSNRKCGLATKLINAIEHQGKNLGCNNFSLNIVPKNDIAKKLYEKLGYNEIQKYTYTVKMAKKT
jgi:RimJ/RimL family protein N-acetyltransferase